jgi:ligand-binding sensor domain-containing protein
VHQNATRYSIVGLVGVAALTAAGFGYVRWRAQQALASAEQVVASEQNLRFVSRPYARTADAKFEWISAPAVFSQAAEFQGHLYVCGPAGLYEFSADGKLEHEYHAGKELPSSPLTRMAPAVLADSGQPELVIATKTEGLLAFNGSSFRQIRPENPDGREITAILPLASGQLLIGTAKNGVLIYDGKRLGPFHPTLSGVHVTELAGDQSDLWIGTLDRGVLHWHGGEADTFGEAQGLPDPQVLSLLVSGARTFVGTPLGVAEFIQGRFARVLAQGAFAQALGADDSTLFIGTLDQGVVHVPLAANPFPGGLAHGSQQIDDVVQIFKSADGTYALARQNLYALGERGGGSPPLIQPADAALTDANISALSVDAAGKLWVGYFDRGLDILEPGWRQARHVEDDRVFCVNRIIAARAGSATAIATANGLIMFDPDANERQILTHADGLIADDVTDVAVEPDGMAIATPAGITFLGADGARSLYAFQGLVNNHVYALGASGDELLAGTLGGISVLDRGEIVANYTTANSGLGRNWISAVVPIGREWMIGTYGGGIVRLDESGKFHSYEIATADFDVNPNAMLVTDHHVYAGSLGQGLFVYDRDSDRWSNITTGLPSENVTALAQDNGYIYIGTDNGLVRVREPDLAP